MKISTTASTVLAILLTAGCGEGTLHLGGGGDGDDDDGTVEFRGTIDDVLPVSSRDIVAFVYSLNEDDDSCPCPGLPPGGIAALDELDGKAAVMESGEFEFHVSGLDSGPFRVIFLLDKAGDDADGHIDDGDDIAILDDVDCELDDVGANLTVTLEDVDLNFAPTGLVSIDCNDDPDDPVLDGRAHPDQIRQQITVDDGSSDD
jgi:hypothetical protein